MRLTLLSVVMTVMLLIACAVALSLTFERLEPRLSFMPWADDRASTPIRMYYSGPGQDGFTFTELLVVL